MVWAVVDRPQEHFRHADRERVDEFAYDALEDHGLIPDPMVDGEFYSYILRRLGGKAKITRSGRNYQVLVDACELLVKRLEAA